MEAEVKVMLPDPDAGANEKDKKPKVEPLDCPGCGKKAVVNLLGPWCDRCGGVASRPGVLLLRHVATVDGAAGRYPIVFDQSTRDYSCSFPQPTARSLAGKRDEDGFRVLHLTTYHGALDAVIALMQPVVRGPKDAAGNPPELPTLEAAPTATKDEIAILEL